MIFADDTQIYHHCHLPLSVVQTDAQAVTEWTRTNGLSLNLTKCKVMVPGSQFYVSQLNYGSLPNILVDNVPFAYVNETWNLGVWLTSTLN